VPPHCGGTVGGRDETGVDVRSCWENHGLMWISPGERTVRALSASCNDHSNKLAGLKREARAYAQCTYAE
jgi:hypothetical protein